MVEIKCIDEYTTRLKMLPVCDCGYVFKDGVVCSMMYHKVGDIEYPMYFIEPNICPNCKKVIECIELDRDKIDFTNGDLSDERL